VRRSEPLPEALDAAYVAELTALAARYGITRTGVAPATVMTRARAELHRRRDAGLHDGMQFTYKNPDRSTDPSRAVRDARAVFVAARPYLLPDHDEVAAAIAADGGVPARVARYAWTDHYAPLREGLWEVARRLRRDGWKAVPFADDNSMVDREIAHRAGLGWFGKNANLLLPGAGSWFVLGSVVTTAPLPVTPDDARVPDGCGSCRRCLDGCPTGAIVDAGVVDAGRCLAWMLQKPGIFPRQHRAALADRLYGCDDCQEACPPTVRLGARRATADPEVRPGTPVEAWVDALDLLEADDQDVLARWGRWYLADRDPRWHRRNALVVVGNGARPGARVERVIAHYVAHDDPVLRVHAVWSARRLGLHQLVPADDPHPDVRDELNAE
jgi:epoxyqueuosine reductase